MIKQIIIGAICTFSLVAFAGPQAGTQRLVLKVGGMTCGSCVEKVKKQLSNVCSDVEVSLENEKVVCDYKSPITEKAILTEAAKTGFKFSTTQSK